MLNATGLSSQKIQDIAEQASEAFEYTNDHDIDRVVDELGGRIILTDFWDNSAKTGSLVVRALRDFDIFVPTHTTEQRDKFTIAHELGHYILHYLPNQDPRLETADQKPIQLDRYGVGPLEVEANIFAYGFLMPEKLFKQAFEENRGNIPGIAAKFYVSEVAARMRAKMLGLYDESTTRAVEGAAEVSPT